MRLGTLLLSSGYVNVVVLARSNLAPSLAPPCSPQTVADVASGRPERGAGGDQRHAEGVRRQLPQMWKNLERRR